MSYTQILLAGLQASYDAIETKDPNLLYFCTDTGKIYKGSVDFSNNVIAAPTKPSTPVAGKIYILADTNTVEVYVNDAWSVISYPSATTIDINSGDLHLATAKAVYDAIQDAVDSIGSATNPVKTVEAGTTSATIKTTKADGTTEEITVPGVVTKPTWDASERKLTIPVTGDTAVEVNIGKDIFIDPTADNGYDEATNSIVVYLNDGTESDDPTKISIPASGLVDIYTGEATTTTTTTVSSDNKISVELKLDPDSGNAIVVGENGLKVDLSAYSKSEVVNAQISAVQTTAENAATKASANETAIAVLNGGVDIEGSVAKQINDVKTPLEQADTALDTRVTNLETTAATTTANVDALATAATTWGSF